MPNSPESERDEAGSTATEGGSLAVEHQPDLAVQLAEMELRHKRALADLDNYRKRAQREIDRRVDESRERLLREWLEVSDSVDRALRMEPTGPAAERLRAVLEHIEAILGRQGVRRVGEAGEAFDPHLHEAVGVREADVVAPGTVVEVARSGFSVGDRVMRPAQVVVSRAGPGDG